MSTESDVHTPIDVEVMRMLDTGYWFSASQILRNMRDGGIEIDATAVDQRLRHLAAAGVIETDGVFIRRCD
jgi:Fe2+ or Zn2+ uptake regulation protein